MVGGCGPQGVWRGPRSKQERSPPPPPQPAKIKDEKAIIDPRSSPDKTALGTKTARTQTKAMDKIKREEAAATKYYRGFAYVMHFDVGFNPCEKKGRSHRAAPPRGAESRREPPSAPAADSNTYTYLPRAAFIIYERNCLRHRDTLVAMSPPPQTSILSASILPIS